MAYVILCDGARAPSLHMRSLYHGPQDSPDSEEAAGNL